MNLLFIISFMSLLFFTGGVGHKIVERERPAESGIFPGQATRSIAEGEQRDEGALEGDEAEGDGTPGGGRRGIRWREG